MSKTVNTITIGWKVASLDINVASVRYRACLPGASLKIKNIHSVYFDSASFSNLDSIDILVIVKCMTEDDVLLAQEARVRGIAVIYELCDNIFIDGYWKRTRKTPEAIFLGIAHHCVAITTTTLPLAEIIRERTHDTVEVFDIPDGSESIMLLPALQKNCKRRLQSASLGKLIRRIGKSNYSFIATTRDVILLTRRINRTIRLRIKKLYPSCLWAMHKLRVNMSFFLWRKRLYRASSRIKRVLGVDANVHGGRSTAGIQGACGRKTILWFGNQGASYAKFGILDILNVAEALENIASEMSVELLVVSSNRSIYEKHIRPIKIPSEYMDWSLGVMKKAFARADVVILPNSLDEFSVCKSANRAVLSLTNDVPVVATKTPALEVLAGCIVFDDFHGGIRAYLTDDVLVQRHLSVSKELIEDNFGAENIARKWLEVCEYALANNREIDNSSTDILICIGLLQDIELAVPVMKELKDRSRTCCVWVSESVLYDSDFILELLAEYAAKWQVIPDDPAVFCAEYFPDDVKAVLAVAESNLKAHKWTNSIIQYANFRGIETYCMQHGLENVGLTFSDSKHDIRAVEMASNYVFTWCNNDQLHPDCPGRTREKCIPTGCPKPVSITVKATCENTSIFAIGVFENLHWHRYSRSYRKDFIECLIWMATVLPEVVFVLQPHPAGKWVQNRLVSIADNHDNIIFSESYLATDGAQSASVLLNNVDAVITSPSTVAFDAARNGLPVCVLGLGMDIHFYKQLYVADNRQQVREFVELVVSGADCLALLESNKKFLSGFVSGNGASGRMLECMLGSAQVDFVTGPVDSPDADVTGNNKIIECGDRL